MCHLLGRKAALLRRGLRGCFASDGPDKAGELTRDRSDGDRLELAPPEQRPIAPIEAGLRLPGDLANLSRRGGDPLLLGPADARRMLIAPGALHQRASRSPIAGLGDRTTFDRVAGRILRW